MAVDWKKLKPASNQMASFMGRAVTGATDFKPMVEAASAKEGKDKAAWGNAKTDVATTAGQVNRGKNGVRDA